MKAKLLHLLHVFQTGFWPLPAVLCLLAIASAHGLLLLDDKFTFSFLQRSNIASEEGLRALLSTIATSFLTLAGLVFSSTLVALTLASSQYGPRLLHNFIHSRSNQFTLGVLLGNFLFSLIVLRQVRDDFLPLLATFSVFVLTLVGLACFIFFVHHLVHSLRAENVIASVYRDLQGSIDSFFPEGETNEENEETAERHRERWEETESEPTIALNQSGYIQRFEIDSLIELASKEDLRLRVLRRPGQLIATGDPVVAVRNCDEISESTLRRVRDAFVVGDQRTPEQDFEFALRQLVEIGTRSLSSGVNDPFTAINCIDLLSISLVRIAKRPLPRRIFRDASGEDRVQTRPTTFRSLLETAFRQLRHDGALRPDISIRMMEGLYLIGRNLSDEDCRASLNDFASQLCSDAEDRQISEVDLEALRELREKIEKSHPSPAGAED